MSNEVNFFADGGCRHQGTSSATGVAACVLKNSQAFGRKKSWTEALPEYPPPTNTRAEISALILAQAKAIELQRKRWRKIKRSKKQNIQSTKIIFVIHSDCQRTVEALNGQISNWIESGWSKKTGDRVANQDLFEKAWKLDQKLKRWKSRVRVVYKWIPREQNWMAHHCCAAKLVELEQAETSDEQEEQEEHEEEWENAESQDQSEESEESEESKDDETDETDETDEDDEDDETHHSHVADSAIHTDICRANNMDTRIIAEKTRPVSSITSNSSRFIGPNLTNSQIDMLCSAGWAQFTSIMVDSRCSKGEQSPRVGVAAHTLGTTGGPHTVYTQALSDFPPLCTRRARLFAIISAQQWYLDNEADGRLQIPRVLEINSTSNCAITYMNGKIEEYKNNDWLDSKGEPAECQDLLQQALFLDGRLRQLATVHYKLIAREKNTFLRQYCKDKLKKLQEVLDCEVINLPTLCRIADSAEYRDSRA
ncbi:hypothetical protein BT63DRAFT_479334 [Microthyrium microscopicum]|uniref:RNase H type-1 domain-containing protein n=1 Tax=Microthyrium microscopicum TaxID=703497 RepID=A0A6A6UBG9_9PEZI|nr:hypothetical protein BT63DRAFT_479334 [Microthyrium microscopicum]